MAFVVAADRALARAWYHANGFGKCPEGEGCAACTRLIDSLSETIAKARAEGSKASFDAAQRAFGL